VRRGRFREEANIDISVAYGGVEEHIVSVKVFCGRPPVYRPWIEVFNSARAGGLPRPLEFHGSRVESWLLDLASERLEGGESLFIEYYRDAETLRELETGVPVAATRLGLEMLKRGFTWLKVWYYPEGFSEGGQKIQGQKPVDERRKRRHLGEIIRELERLVASPAGAMAATSLQRAREALRVARELQGRLG
jgi:hypothetical protein